MSATWASGPGLTLVSYFPLPTFTRLVRILVTCSSTSFMPVSTAWAATFCRSGSSVV